MVQGILWGGANNWHALSCRSTGEDNSELNFKDCVMTLNWLTLYDIYPVLSVRWGYYEEYIGPTVIEYGKKMAILARKKIRFVLEHNIELRRTVDGATFMTREMRLDPSSEWYDWKTHSYGLVSGLCIVTTFYF